MIRRIACIILAMLLLTVPFVVFAAGEQETVVFHVDSINGTRWADLICVYKDVPHTNQNEWGENIVVSAEGKVVEKIAGGDIKGKNLAVPEGGMVVSGTGDIGKEMFASAEIGDNCLFDEITMRVYFSKGEIDTFYTKKLRVTGYNSTRWSNTVIIYNRSGEKTGTNPYGYEACVDNNGYIISLGGNDNTVPNGGYVISVTEQEDILQLKLYFTVGARCTLENDSVTAVYGEAELAQTARAELDALKTRIESAEKQYLLVDTASARAEADKIDINSIKTLADRNAAIERMRDIEDMLVESRGIETRSVWYTATEKTASEIKATVAKMKQAGFNELVLASNTENGTIIPIDTKQIPFKRDSVVRRLDILQTYIDECRANGISIVVLVPVMGNTFAEQHTEWFDKTNTGELRDEIFFSPANEEYRKAFMDYVRFILENYDIDGLQLDYIRYPHFYTGVDGGYDEATVKLFTETTGLGSEVVAEIGKKLTDHPEWENWVKFKSELINSWVEEIHGLSQELRPDIFVSAAVAANDGYNTYCQDVSAWVSGGYIDGIYVMSYEEGVNSITVNRFKSIVNDDVLLIMGCGAYLSITERELIEETVAASQYGADGIAYFEWGAVDAHGYTDIMQSILFKNDAIAVTDNADTVVKALMEQLSERISASRESIGAETADKLAEKLSALPESPSRDDISAVLDFYKSTLDNESRASLTRELSTALRVLNNEREDYVFKKPSDSTDSSTESTESLSESEHIGDDENMGVFPIIAIIVLVLAVTAIVTVVVIKKKK